MAWGMWFVNYGFGGRHVPCGVEVGPVGPWVRCRGGRAGRSPVFGVSPPAGPKSDLSDLGPAIAGDQSIM